MWVGGVKKMDGVDGVDGVEDVGGGMMVIQFSCTERRRRAKCGGG